MAEMGPDDLKQLQAFVEAVKACPDILHAPPLKFFRDYIESLGGKIPPSSTKPEPEATTKPAPPEPEKMEEDTDPESDVELDNEGVIEPESEPLPELYAYNEAEVISEEDMDKSREKASEAMSAMGDGNFAAAISAFSEAIKLNPKSAAMYAKRANALLKQKRVNAALQDCNQAIKINPDSAVAHKFRGRAYRLLGKWLEAAKDLRLATKLDCDEQAIEWLAEVQPNAAKLEEHERKKQRKKEEKEINAKRERVRKAQQANEEARRKEQETFQMPDDEGMPNMGGMGDMFDDPEIAEGLKDPEVIAALTDISKNPANLFKYKDDPKISKVLGKFAKKFEGQGGMGGMGGMPGMGGMGGMPGMGGMGGMPGFGGPGGFSFGGGSAEDKPKSGGADDLD